MESSDSPFALLLKSISLIPFSHFLLGFLLISLVFLYNFLEIHILYDLIVTGFRGHPVSLSFASGSQLYQVVASKCQVLHGRYLATPWLSSPHLQTAFLSFYGRPPVFSYRRQLFHTSDGGTIALDWLKSSDVMGVAINMNDTICKDDKTPIVIVIPGLTSDSASAYIKHLAFKIAKSGWNVVVSNHRGLGGIAITSDCMYNAGWTEDIRRIVDHLRGQYPEASLFAVGTSIGANVLVKYLGEEGVNIPLVGAAAICSPWDLLICDRFLNRKLVQKFYDKALTIGLQGYAQLHQPVLSRLADWEGIKKSRSVRDFDNYATRLVGKYETVDTYYRRCSSASFVGNVSVPLLCISTLDDPVCTREAIPWDECKANKNIILAITKNGGHLGFFEGLAANSVWWVRAVDEFFNILHSTQFIHRKKEASTLPTPLESSIDQAPYVNVTKEGMVTAVANKQTNMEEEEEEEEELCIDHRDKKDEDKISVAESSGNKGDERTRSKTETLSQPSKQDLSGGANAPVRSRMDQLSRYSRKSIWLLVYIAVVTTWPLVGSALLVTMKRKFKNALPAALFNR